MNISIIVAITANGAIGRTGELLFNIREDMRHFRNVTMGHPIIMGRRTFESFPNGALPGRRNMVITRNSSYTAPGAETFGSLTAAIAAVAHDDEAMIIGGGEIYAAALPLASRLYLTEIDAIVDDADTYFPAIDPTQWTIETAGDWQTDPTTQIRYRFVCMTRR